jgi:hypothetical protein
MADDGHESLGVERNRKKEQTTSTQQTTVKVKVQGRGGHQATMEWDFVIADEYCIITIILYYVQQVIKNKNNNNKTQPPVSSIIHGRWQTSYMVI